MRGSGLFSRNKGLAAIFLVVFIDMLGFGIIIPVLPYYAEAFGADPTLVGLLIASYSAAQLVGAPFLGRFSDRYGRKPVIMFSIVLGFLGYIFLGLATSLWIVFLSRIIAGIAGGNLSVAQAYIADTTDTRDRARGMGLIGASFGLGFILGPAIGGTLSVYGFTTPFYAAAALELVNLLMVAAWLREPSGIERRAPTSRPLLGISPLKDLLKHPMVGRLLQIRLLYLLAFTMFEAMFILYAEHRFGLDAQLTSYLLVYIGLIVVFVQGVLIGKLTSRFSEWQLIVAGLAMITLALLGWALTNNLLILLAVLAPMAMSAGILNTVISSALSKVVGRDEVGEVMGISTSIGSLTRIVGPTIGGVVFQQLGTGAPGIAGAVLTAATLPLAIHAMNRKSRREEK